jgi:hypothetical protein
LRLFALKLLQIYFLFHNGSVRGLQIIEIFVKTIIVGGHGSLTMFNLCHFGVGSGKLHAQLSVSFFQLHNV